MVQQEAMLISEPPPNLCVLSPSLSPPLSLPLSLSLSGTETSGVVEIEGLDISTVKGKDVLIMEDIVDSGLTLSRICSLLRGEGGAASVKVCALLDKRARRKVEFEADWVGFDCPDEFVVGYGIGKI